MAKPEKSPVPTLNTAGAPTCAYNQAPKNVPFTNTMTGGLPPTAMQTNETISSATAQRWRGFWRRNFFMTALF